MINRRAFLISTGCLGISTAVASSQLTTSESAKQTLSGKKLVPPASGMIKVACALSKDVTPIDWVGPQAVFGAWLYDDSLKRDRPLFEVFTVGESREPVDQWLVPDYTYEDAPEVQVIVIPAQSGSLKFYEWLKKANKNSDVTMSVCIGARHLANLGLLDGQVATTHHDYIKPFTDEFPQVHWVSGVRFVEGPKISTSAGVTAGIDLALHVVERYSEGKGPWLQLGCLSIRAPAGWFSPRSDCVRKEENPNPFVLTCRKSSNESYPVSNALIVLEYGSWMDASSTGQVASPNRLSKTLVNLFLQKLPTMRRKTRTYLALAAKTSEDFQDQALNRQRESCLPIAKFSKKSKHVPKNPFAMPIENRIRHHTNVHRVHP